MRSLWFLTLLPLVACESVESKDVGTDAMSAQIEVISADGASTRVNTTLRVGGLTSNTYVQLTGDDQLTADDGTGPIEMSYLSIGDYWTYIADFSVAAADTNFAVALVRSLDDGAPSSTATLPAPFDLTAPAEATADIDRTEAMSACRRRKILHMICLFFTAQAATAQTTGPQVAAS